MSQRTDLEESLLHTRFTSVCSLLSAPDLSHFVLFDARQNLREVRDRLRTREAQSTQEAQKRRVHAEDDAAKSEQTNAFLVLAQASSDQLQSEPVRAPVAAQLTSLSSPARRR